MEPIGIIIAAVRRAVCLACARTGAVVRLAEYPFPVGNDSLQYVSFAGQVEDALGIVQQFFVAHKRKEFRIELERGFCVQCPDFRINAVTAAGEMEPRGLCRFTASHGDNDMETPKSPELFELSSIVVLDVRQKFLVKLLTILLHALLFEKVMEYLPVGELIEIVGFDDMEKVGLFAGDLKVEPFSHLVEGNSRVGPQRVVDDVEIGTLRAVGFRISVWEVLQCIFPAFLREPDRSGIFPLPFEPWRPEEHRVEIALFTKSAYRAPGGSLPDSKLRVSMC